MLHLCAGILPASAENRGGCNNIYSERWSVCKLSSEGRRSAFQANGCLCTRQHSVCSLLFLYVIVSGPTGYTKCEASRTFCFELGFCYVQMILQQSPYHAPYVLPAGRAGLLCMGTGQELSRSGSAPLHDIRTAELHAFMHHLLKPQHSPVAKCCNAMQNKNHVVNPMCIRIVIQAMGRRHAGMAV